MSIPVRPRIATEVPDLEWLVTDDGSRTLWNRQLDETYHSGCGAVAESLYVYLLASGVAKRLLDRQPTSVLEVGWGTATTFLLAAALAEQCATPLRYTALDCQLLPTAIYQELPLFQHIESALDCCQAASVRLRPMQFSRLEPLRAELVARVMAWQQVFPDDKESSPPTGSLDRMHDASEARAGANTNTAIDQKSARVYPTVRLSAQLGQMTQLQLLLGDAGQFRRDCVSPTTSPCDAVLFDAFSPRSSPELWTEPLFSSCHEMLKPGGVLTSYCVKSSVCRKLRASGFRVQKNAGPRPGKREILIASKL